MTSPSNSWLSGRPWRRCLILFLAPLAILVLWTQLLQGDRLEAVESRYHLPALVYDPYDAAAMALRGLNADRGRQAGDLTLPEHYLTPLQRVDQKHALARNLQDDPPLRPRYFLEYPHAALLLFRTGFLIQPGARDIPVPPAFADGDYHDIVTFEPQRPDHVALMRSFVFATRFYAAAACAGWLGLALVLTWGYEEQARFASGAALLLLPATLYFSLNRFDVLPALLTALAFACLGRQRRGASALFLGLAVLIKVYPIVFAPLVVRYLWPERRAAIRWTAILAATGLLAFVPLLFGADLTAVLAPYRYQLTRPAEAGLTIYGCILPPDLAEPPYGPVFRLAALAGTLTLVLYQPIGSLTGLLRRCSLVLLVVVSLAVFYSPQWVVWFAPLLLPLAGQERRLRGTFALLDLITYATFPVWFWVLAEVIPALVGTADGGTMHHYFGAMLRAVRFAISTLLAWQLVRAEWPTILNNTWLSRTLPHTTEFLLHKI